MPTAAAIAAAEIIIRETAYAAGGEVRPLPLLGSFNTTVTTGWDPDYQMELLEAGHKLCPWFAWPEDIDVGDPAELATFDAYYQEYIEYCEELGLPLWFRFNPYGFERILATDATYETGDPATSARVIKPDGTVLTTLSPFGLLAHWDAPAAECLDRDSWRRIQSWYPSPPMVMFHSNNEVTKLRWTALETDSKYYVDTYGTEQTDAFKKALIADAWTERYQRMIAAMRTTLEADSEDWAGVARFVAYDAFGPSFIGRWAQWEEYALVTDSAITPDWVIWDGGTMSYYDNYWQTAMGDYLVYSNQVEACNFPFQEAEAKTANPDYLCELALWTGDGSSGSVPWYPAMGYSSTYEARSKTCQYLGDGQTWNIDRYAGWAQFGLWMTRPFILREFRFSTEDKDNWPGYFDRLTEIVDRIHDDPVLTEFWRDGTLVANEDYDHPYQEEIPSQYTSVERSYLLTTSVDPERPWDLTDTVPVFALAYVLGTTPNRSWLLYAHAPLESQDCTITIPGYDDVDVHVPREGHFWIYKEQDVAYRFTARSTTPGEYVLASGTLSQLVAVGDIQQGVNRGDGGLGTFVVPATGDVEQGVQYGAAGTEFTGTMLTGGGGDTIGVFGVRRIV